MKPYKNNKNCPLYFWYDWGADNGYSDGYWDRNPDTPLSNTPKFPSKEAEEAYNEGYKTGFANGSLDE